MYLLYIIVDMRGDKNEIFKNIISIRINYFTRL